MPDFKRNPLVGESHMIPTVRIASRIIIVRLYMVIPFSAVYRSGFLCADWNPWGIYNCLLVARL
eukprot:3232549-Pyramimonas_sp.AAC.1